MPKKSSESPPVQRVVCSEAISLCYRPAPKDTGFHIRSSYPVKFRKLQQGVFRAYPKPSVEYLT